MSAVLDTHAAIFERIVHELAQDNPAFGVFPLDYNVASALRSIPCGVVPDMPDRIIAATGPLADERRILFNPGSRVNICPIRYGITCSIAAHAGPRGSVQPAAEHHPSTSATECGYRADRPRDRVR